ncbi:MAG TPA: carboxypeptidase regulatory-like domain-containing protein, partial [Candidatus Atribacteria bacterium]|nr:carboxypeptidase regulatory-like domain-containing protein [Candidatus Atribacteria bacterium]
MKNSFQSVTQKIIPKRFILIIVVISIILPVLANLTPTLADSSQWWDHRWSYRQEIHIPMDTSLNQAKFQPIDMKIKFDYPCWAKNETVNSIRVIFQEEAKIEEIESQIYDLHYIDRDHIDSCNIVCLIPKYADGKEKYYVYYSDTETPPSNYPNHVDVKEVHYNYEYMPGYSISADYYQIEEKGFIPFIIALEGNSLEGSFSQQITRLKPKSIEILPQNSELLASFDFMYYYGNDIDDYSSSYEQLISKKILVDGNLMVKVSVTSKSTRNDLKTTAIYTYYYCPKENKRIYVHVKHEVLKECRVAPGKFSTIDGTFVTFHYYSFRSNSRKELNFGEIPPYAHLYTEDKIVREYKLDTYPHNAPNDWCMRIVDTSDDIDLADIPWSSF